MEFKEYILCSAIWYKDLSNSTFNPININKGIVITGYRHNNCIDVMSTLIKKRTVRNASDGVGDYIQGFLTSKNRFVDRKEGMSIALSAEQIKKSVLEDKLFSEDLY